MNDQADTANDIQESAAKAQQQDAAGSPEATQADRPRARIKIGSQRQASGVFRAKPQLAAPQPEAPAKEAAIPHQPAAPAREVSTSSPTGDVIEQDSLAPVETGAVETSASENLAMTPGGSPGAKTAETPRDVPNIPMPRSEPIPKPSVRDAFTDDMEQELEAAMSGVALDAMLVPDATKSSGAELEADSLHRGRVLFVRGSDVFIDLGGRNQGLVPAAQFEVLPKPDDVLDVSVRRFDAAEGLYELSVPHAAVSVAGWDQISEGMVVDATVTGHNSGGLEVEVNKLRGFIPISQVSIYRVEVLAEFVGQRLTCVVTEVNPQARNLVLSRRAMLERERAEAKIKLLEELDVGQIRDGVVTRLQPFGAFVDLGGIDGLIHVSQMSWDRVADPSEVLEVGQKIKVRVTKMDKESGKIGLSYRESWENPWDSAERKYTPKSRVTGTVSKLTDFGAFVKLEPGIEGLVHISELAHRRVFRSSDVVKEGQEVDVLILSLDKEQQRISLSLKALEARPEPTGKKKEEEDLAIPTPIPQRKNQGPLKGGISGPSGGEKFGLKW